MTLNQALTSLKDKTIDQIKTLKFNLDHYIYFTLELQPELHDAVLKACEIKIKELRV